MANLIQVKGYAILLYYPQKVQTSNDFYPDLLIKVTYFLMIRRILSQFKYRNKLFPPGTPATRIKKHSFGYCLHLSSPNPKDLGRVSFRPFWGEGTGRAGLHSHCPPGENQQPPGYGRQSQTAHRRPQGNPISGSLVVFDSREPGGLRWMNRRSDLSLEASPGDDFDWKMMIPYSNARRSCGFSSNCSPCNQSPVSSLGAFSSNNTAGK